MGQSLLLLTSLLNLVVAILVIYDLRYPPFD
jgi:hypothetical protein